MSARRPKDNADITVTTYGRTMNVVGVERNLVVMMKANRRRMKPMVQGKKDTLVMRLKRPASDRQLSPENQADEVIFRHCNSGRAASSAWEFVNEVWPVLQLHGYTNHSVGGVEGILQKGEEGCQR